MIDLHTHILPGLDDGAQDLKESLNMANMAAKNGTKIIVATPHRNLPGYKKRGAEDMNCPKLCGQYKKGPYSRKY